MLEKKLQVCRRKIVDSKWTTPNSRTSSNISKPMSTDFSTFVENSKLQGEDSWGIPSDNKPKGNPPILKYSRKPKEAAKDKEPSDNWQIPRVPRRSKILNLAYHIYIYGKLDLKRSI